MLLLTLSSKSPSVSVLRRWRSDGFSMGHDCLAVLKFFVRTRIAHLPGNRACYRCLSDRVCISSGGVPHVSRRDGHAAFFTMGISRLVDEQVRRICHMGAVWRIGCCERPWFFFFCYILWDGNYISTLGHAYEDYGSYRVLG